MHMVTAADLVQQHVENSTPDSSARGALKRGKHARMPDDEVRLPCTA